ncbi:helix-turn-helix domain-containing protein [Microbacterium luticocti]|uniref:helix-turn-helix domain-containing protein n=1 Tax=Microbacterium luticocti TaxID=451764 RepID=UPI00041E2CEF|nr:helix-turn-helix domain-containing protein [Microbacterium luticocti]
MTPTAPRREHDGFTMIPDWLVESTALPLHDYAVLIVLMKHARTSGQCHPGFATISAQARVSRDTVMRSLRSLEARGLISIERRRVGAKNLPNLYTLHVEPGLVVADSDHQDDDAARRVVAPSDQVDADSDQGWSLPATQTRVINESHERPSRVQRFASHDEADDVVDVEAIESGDTPSAGGRSGCTDAQVSLLSDLFILSGQGIPDERQIVRWRNLTNDECTTLMARYWQRLDQRGPARSWPIDGEPEYEHLTARGKQWADVGCLPGQMEP